MIKRGEALGDDVRRFVGRGRGDCEAQVFGNGRHGGDGLDIAQYKFVSRITHRHLDSIPNRRLRTALVGIVQTVRVGQEEGIEVALFEQLRQIRPVGEVASLRRRSIFGVLPLAEGEMADSEHVESIEVDPFFERWAIAIAVRFYWCWCWCCYCVGFSHRAEDFILQGQRFDCL
ncbi:hypothetical protein VTN77DRAFT_2938 [Rasamsonia byssochlamydoides]|uniref:uncharacterized protein n=1 Tax=Rasamsonia byssochlamydoides TaxID=89139 RepID=UPI003743E978